MAPIGIFDSGIGGLTVWREITRHLPHANTVYVADQSHLPYGARDAREILTFARAITRFLVRAGCRVIVVACNTASAVALLALREESVDVQFVGMEPAIKPAAALSRNGVVAVLATPATLHGSLFERTAGGLDHSIEIVRQPCPGLVEWIEAGNPDDSELRLMLEGLLQAPRAAGADTVVLACTHYPFVRDAIQRLLGPDVRIVDPAAAVAKQLQRIVTSQQIAPSQQRTALQRCAPHRDDASAQHIFWTTGDTSDFARVAAGWLQRAVQARSLRWQRGDLEILHDKRAGSIASRRAVPRHQSA